MSHHPFRDVAQLGRAHAWGAWGRRFKSCHPDRRKPAEKTSGWFFLFSHAFPPRDAVFPYEINPICLPAQAIRSIAISMSSSVIAAVMEKRMRAVPSGTVGGRMASRAEIASTMIPADRCHYVDSGNRLLCSSGCHQLNSHGSTHR